MNTFLSRRNFIQSIGAAGLPSLLPGLAQAARKPNIVIFYADDLGYNDLDCYGADELVTPNIDALAAAGTRFTQWYCNSPVCSPSRASLLTGRYPQRTGVPGNVPAGMNSDGLNPEEITLAEMTKSVGYATGHMGKWHQGTSEGSRPNDQGFDETYGFLSGCVDYYSHMFYWNQNFPRVPYHDLWYNNERVWENGTYMTDIITREARRFVREHASDEFFLFVPYSTPHYPMHAPKKYFDLVDHIEDEHRKVQAAMVASLDESIGDILTEIREQGLENDTLVFFISDNGPSAERRNLMDDSRTIYHGASAAPYRGFKGSMLEGGIRVPAIARWPGIVPAGAVSEEWLVTMDLFPTLATLLHAPLPEDLQMDGLNVWATLSMNVPSPHRQVCWGLGKQRAIRQGSWKLILDTNGGIDLPEEPPVLLYNLADDPYEKNNLAETIPDRVASMKEALQAWENDVGIG